MTLFWLYLALAIFGGYLMLVLLGNERRQRSSFLEYEQQVRLYHEMLELKKHGKL